MIKQNIFLLILIWITFLIIFSKNSYPEITDNHFLLLTPQVKRSSHNTTIIIVIIATVFISLFLHLICYLLSLKKREIEKKYFFEQKKIEDDKINQNILKTNQKLSSLKKLPFRLTTDKKCFFINNYFPSEKHYRVTFEEFENSKEKKCLLQIFLSKKTKIKSFDDFFKKEMNLNDQTLQELNLNKNVIEKFLKNCKDKKNKEFFKDVFWRLNLVLQKVLKIFFCDIEVMDQEIVIVKQCSPFLFKMFKNINNNQEMIFSFDQQQYINETQNNYNIHQKRFISLNNHSQQQINDFLQNNQPQELFKFLISSKDYCLSELKLFYGFQIFLIFIKRLIYELQYCIDETVYKEKYAKLQEDLEGIY